MIFFKTNISKPLSYYKCGQFICEKNWHHKTFIFDRDYEIIIGIKGTIYLQQGSEKYVVNPGDVLFLIPGVVHFGYDISTEGTSFYWLHFFCNSEEILLNDGQIYQEIISISDKSKLQENILLPTFFSLRDTGKSLIYMKQILNAANSPYYTHLAVNYLVTELTIELTQQFLNSLNILKDPTVNKKFFEILEWIRVNITKNISVQIVAHEFEFTPDYLTRLFKKNIGMSTLKYINSLKINRAKELLINTDKTIKEVSYTLNFNDEKYFMKLFKQFEKLTPTQYRDAYPKTYINTDSTDPAIPMPSYLT